MSVFTSVNKLSVFTFKTVGQQRNISNVGFVGLGNMGAFMAKNLMKKGYKLTVYDVNKQAIDNVVKAGAKGAGDVAEVSKNSELVVTMLPMNQHVLSCYTDKNGIIEAAKEGTILVDSSTIDPSVSQTVAKEAEKKGLKFMDGPVSGGVVGAENGTLTFMVGGAKSHYEQAKAVLEAMGSRSVHCGDVGMGQVAKICNNMLLAISMIGVSEALNLGNKLGLDPKVLTDIINTSTGRCWSSEVYNPVPGLIATVPSSKNYEGGFSTALITKDLGLAQAAATRSGSVISLGALSHQIYSTMSAHKLGNKDFSVIYQFLQGENKK